MWQTQNLKFKKKFKNPSFSCENFEIFSSEKTLWDSHNSFSDFTTMQIFTQIFWLPPSWYQKSQITIWPTPTIWASIQEGQLFSLPPPSSPMIPRAQHEAPCSGRSQHDKTRGVSHYGLAIYIKKAKEELWKLKYFTMQMYNLQKNPLKETQNASRYYNSITNLKLNKHKPKISSFTNPHVKISLLPRGQNPFKLLYSIMNLNTISFAFLVGKANKLPCFMDRWPANEK